MIIYFGLFLFVVIIVAVNEERSIGKVLLKSIPVFFIWTLFWWWIIGMHYSTEVNSYIKNGKVVGITEYDKFPLTSFVGDFVDLNIRNSSGLFGVVTEIKTGSWFKYIRLYNDGTERFDKIPSDKVFIKKDATSETAYLARRKVRPKLSIFQKIMIVPPFLVTTYETEYWVAHVPPNSVVYKFKMELK